MRGLLLWPAQAHAPNSDPVGEFLQKFGSCFYHCPYMDNYTRLFLTIVHMWPILCGGPKAAAGGPSGPRSDDDMAHALVASLLADMHSLADPTRDQEGLILSRSKTRIRARRGEALDNDF